MDITGQLSSSVESAKNRMQRFRTMLPEWKMLDSLQQVQKLETAINRMKNVHNEVKIDLAEAKSGIAAGDCADSVEVMADADGVMKTIKSFIYELEDALDDIDKTPVRSEKSGDAHIESARHQPKMPELKLPQFNGKPWEWHNFISAFKQRVDASQCSPLDKLEYLRQCVHGEAYQTVASYILDGKNYEPAMKRLEEQYGNRQLIISEMLNKMTRVTCRSESWSDQRQAVTLLISLYNQLKEAGANVDNEMIWKNIYNKFPEKTKDDLENFIDPMDSCNVHDLLSEIDKLITRKIARQTITDDGNPRKEWKHKLRESKMEMIRKTAPEGAQKFGAARDYSSSYNTNSRITYTANNRAEGFPKNYITSSCRWCGDKNHLTTACTNYLTVKDRTDVAKEKRLCFNCLEPGHLTIQCMKNSCFTCRKKHHTSLCPEKNQGYSRRESKGDIDHQLCVVDKTKAQSRAGKSYILSGSAIVSDASGRIFENLTVVMDSAANRTFVTKRVADKLQLPRIGSANIATIGFGQNKANNEQSDIRELNITLPNSKKMTIQAVEKAEIMGDWIHRPNLTEEDKNCLSKLQLQLLESKKELQKRRKRDILIGTDYLWQFWCGIPQKLPSGLYVVPTALGAMISGRQDLTDPPTENSTCLVAMTEDDPEMMNRISMENANQIASEWQDDIELATYGGPSTEEKKNRDKKIWKHFENTIECRKDGHYVRLPFKENKNELPDNLPIAFSRLKSVERTYGADKYVMKNYEEIFQDQIKKNIIELVEAKEPEKGRLIHYLAHQPVITPHKDTTKVRIVFDASAHFRGSVSLNDVLYQGPTILPLIVGMYLRFRTGSIVVSGDVEKAFLQVRLHEEDRDATRFLWVKDSAKPWRGENIVVYRYCSIPFGLNASPFLLGATIAHHFKKSADPEFAKEIIENTYVDNVILTCNSKEEAIAKYETSKNEFSAMKMNLREFMTNDRDVYDAFQSSDRSENITPKVLGTKWLSAEDAMEITAVFKDMEKMTKRAVSSQVAAVYDPLGLLAPLLLRAKKFQQTLWVTYRWDEILKPEDVLKWEQIVANINGFAKKIPRSITPVGSVVKLIVFSDANIDTMAACCYVVYNGNSEIAMSRSRLKPLKTKATIPKLEMNAYIMAIELSRDIHKELKSRITIDKVVVMTDSMITLGWIQSPTPPAKEGVYIERRWRNFRQISHSLSNEKIQTYVGHVISEENPADCATRGLSKQEIASHFWWKGPEYIVKPIEEWPNRCKIQELSEEANIEDQIVLLTQETRKPTSAVPWKATKSLQKLTNVVAWVLRFIRRKFNRLSEDSRKKHQDIGLMIEDGNEPHISVMEKHIAQDLIVRIHQKEMETEGRLKEQKHLDLFKDKKGIWRCGGRLRNCDLPDSTRFPIFIDSKSLLAEMIVNDAHIYPGMKPIHRSNRSTIATMFPKQSPEKAEVEDEELLDYDDEEMVDGDMNQKEGQTKKDDGDILKAAKKLLQASNQEQNIRSCLEQRLALQRVAQDLVQLEQSLLMVNPTRMSLERLQSAVDQNKQHTMRAIKRMEEADNKSRNHNELMSEAARMAGQAATTYPWSKEAKKTYQMDYEDRLRTVQASIDTLKTTYRPNMSAAGCSSTSSSSSTSANSLKDRISKIRMDKTTRRMILIKQEGRVKKHMNKCELSHVCKACRRWGHNTTMCRYYEDVDKIIADLEEELKKIDRPEPSGQ